MANALDQLRRGGPRWTIEEGPATALARAKAQGQFRRKELRLLVPLSDTTIYEMEQRGEFPKRFYLTPRCAARDLGEVQG